MAFPYTEVFLGLLLVYMVYSVWARLDARFPIAASLVLLVATAVVDALGHTASANMLAEFVFFLLGAGVVLLLVDHVREGRHEGRGAAATSDPASSGLTAEAVPSDPPYLEEGNGEKSLDGVEQEPVPLVHALPDGDLRDAPYRGVRAHEPPDEGTGERRDEAEDPTRRERRDDPRDGNVPSRRGDEGVGGELTDRGPAAGTLPDGPRDVRTLVAVVGNEREADHSVAGAGRG